MATPEYKIKLSADATGVDRAVAQAKGSLSRLGADLRGLQSIASKALNFAGIGGAVSVTGILAAARGMATLSKEVSVLATVSGTSAETFQGLAFGARQVGIEQEKLADIFKDVQDKVGDFLETGGGPLADFFENIAPQVGVTAEQFRNLSGPQALQLYVSSLEKANVSQSQMTFYMEAIASDSARLVPLLRENGRAWAEAATEAERLGVVLGEELVRQGVELEKNLQRLEAQAKGVGISIGSVLIPALNDLAAQFLGAQKAGLGFFQALYRLGVESAPGESPEDAIARVSDQLDALRKRREDALSFVGGNAGASVIVPSIDKEVAALEAALRYFEGERDRLADERVEKERETSSEIQKLEAEKQRRIRQLNDDTAAARKQAQADEIAAAKEIKKNLEEAWKASTQEAKTAAAEAKRLLEEASSVRQSGADRAQDRRMRGMTADERDSFARREVRNLTDEARSASVFAQNAALDGNLTRAATLAAQAAKFAERAEKFADQIEDDGTAANAIEELTRIRAEALETTARIQEQTAADKGVVADLLAQRISEADAKIVELQNKAKGIQLEADATQAQTEIDALQAKIDALKDKTVTVTVNTVHSGATAEAAPGFAAGGYTGPGSKYQPAGVVHAGEFVLRQEVVRMAGMRSILETLNRTGRLPGYAAGGMVAARPAAPAAASGTPVVLDLGALGKYSTTASADVAEEITRAFSRAALQRGRRK